MVLYCQGPHLRFQCEMSQASPTSICCILILNRAVNQRFLCTWRTCVNKPRQPRGLTEMCGRYKRIYSDAHVRYGQSVSLSLRPEEIRSVSESGSEYLGAPLGLSPTERLRNSVLIWQSVFICLCLSVSLIPQKIWPFSREIKKVSFLPSLCCSKLPWFNFLFLLLSPPRLFVSSTRPVKLLWYRSWNHSTSNCVQCRRCTKQQIRWLCHNQ